MPLNAPAGTHPNDPQEACEPSIIIAWIPVFDKNLDEAFFTMILIAEIDGNEYELEEYDRDTIDAMENGMDDLRYAIDEYFDGHNLKVFA